MSKEYSVLKRQDINQLKITQYNSGQFTQYEFIRSIYHNYDKWFDFLLLFCN